MTTEITQEMVDVMGTGARLSRAMLRSVMVYNSIKDQRLFTRAKSVEVIDNSDTQLYKQAGNAVTVNVIESIGRRLQ